MPGALDIAENRLGPDDMALIIQKFGGTSVANAQNIEKVKNIAAKASNTEKAVIVVSAFGGVTDMLVKASLLAAAQDETYKQVLEEIEAAIAV